MAKQQIEVHTTFRLRKTNAVLSNWNPRIEKHGEDHEFASDLTFTVSVPGSVLNDLSFPDAPWNALIWDKDDNVRDIGITEFKFDTRYLNHKFIMTVGSDDEFAFSDATIRKISATPKAGKRVELKFQAQIHPEDSTLKEIKAALKRDSAVSVKIEPLKSSTAVRDSTEPELPLGEPETEEAEA